MISSTMFPKQQCSFSTAAAVPMVIGVVSGFLQGLKKDEPPSIDSHALVILTSAAFALASTSHLDYRLPKILFVAFVCFAGYFANFYSQKIASKWISSKYLGLVETNPKKALLEAVTWSDESFVLKLIEKLSSVHSELFADVFPQLRDRKMCCAGGQMFLKVDMPTTDNSDIFNQCFSDSDKLAILHGILKEKENASVPWANLKGLFSTCVDGSNYPLAGHVIDTILLKAKQPSDFYKGLYTAFLKCFPISNATTSRLFSHGKNHQSWWETLFKDKQYVTWAIENLNSIPILDASQGFNLAHMLIDSQSEVGQGTDCFVQDLLGKDAYSKYFNILLNRFPELICRKVNVDGKQLTLLSYAINKKVKNAKFLVHIICLYKLYEKAKREVIEDIAQIDLPSDVNNIIEIFEERLLCNVNNDNLAKVVSQLGPGDNALKLGAFAVQNPDLGLQGLTDPVQGVSKGSEHTLQSIVARSVLVHEGDPAGQHAKAYALKLLKDLKLIRPNGAVIDNPFARTSAAALQGA